jgi:hypothetical protein
VKKKMQGRFHTMIAKNTPGLMLLNNTSLVQIFFSWNTIQKQLPSESTYLRWNAKIPNFRENGHSTGIKSTLFPKITE